MRWAPAAPAVVRAPLTLLTAEAGERVIMSVAPSVATASRCPPLLALAGSGEKVWPTQSNTRKHSSQVAAQTPPVMPSTCAGGPPHTRTRLLWARGG